MKHSGSSPCILAFLALAAIVGSQPPATPKLGDIGAERELDLTSASTSPSLEAQIPYTSDAEWTPTHSNLRQARKTPPVVKSQAAMTPDIPAPSDQEKDRPPPGRTSPLVARHTLTRVQTRGPISSEPSESLLLG